MGKPLWRGFEFEPLGERVQHFNTFAVRVADPRAVRGVLVSSEYGESLHAQLSATSTVPASLK